MSRQSKRARLSEYADTPLQELLTMLATMRPADSREERRFVERWVAPLGTAIDRTGNHTLRIGDAPVLWSCHTDTVHRRSGRQKIAVTGDKIQLAPFSGASCLGADCTTGVWLMREMILARVPGLYVFHAGEEIGGIGSQYIASHRPGLLAGIEYAIAFDRARRDSVITHQAGGRCCSTEFAVSIAEQLPGNYCLDAGGTFTDTANYMDIIPECSNISIGYEHAHSRLETQSVSHALALRKALLQIKPERFVCARDPAAFDLDVDFGLFPRHRFGGAQHENDLWAELECDETDSFLDGPYTYPAYYEKSEDIWDDNFWEPRKFKY